jgi:hypothetical protein
MAKPARAGNIVVTIYTEEGKTYTAMQKLPDILAHNTISTQDAYIDVNIRSNHVTGVKYRVMDVAL